MSEQNPNLKDTKQTILSAYQKTVAKVKELEAGKLNPQAELKAKELAELLAGADETVAQGLIETRVLALKKDLGGMLDTIAAGVTEQVKSYNQVQEAIKVKEERLQELFGIEAEAFALVALINAKEEIAREYEENFVARKKESEEQLEKLRRVAQEERASIQKELAETRANIEKDRKREEEDYKYNTKRKRQQEEDTFQDELNAKKREFNDKCEEFTKTLNAREESVIEREEAVAEREDKLDELEATIEELKANKATEIEEAVKQAKADANSSFYREKAYIEKEAKHQVQLMESKVSMLENSLLTANETIENLNVKLEKAYTELRDLAKSTVDNAGNQKVIAQLERMALNQKSGN